MTDAEARKVMAICNGADSGCIVCAERLRNDLTKAFPEHEEAFMAVYAAEYIYDEDGELL